ncbi:CLIP-associating protein 2 isoform X3 [Hyalella azteca]|uniref:CLIP-associating protein 2 isoform X3 n=1 Tax=Hyalella azteca TaxID=294128 RepID=A0A979FVI3_HYAAZ|nr:CLIP-associating protein 2 isoform X3 [Hyalella azteca]
MPSGSPSLCVASHDAADRSVLDMSDDMERGSGGDMRPHTHGGSLTPTLSLQCSFGSLGSLDSGHSSELGMGQSASTPDSCTPPPSSDFQHSSPRQLEIIASCGDGATSVGTPPLPTKNDNTPPNFFDSFSNEVPAMVTCSTPVPLAPSSDEEGTSPDEVLRCSSRDSGRPVTVARSDSMGSNASRKSDASTLSAVSAVSAVSNYSATTNLSSFSNFSGDSESSFASTLSRKSGLSSLTGASQSCNSSAVSDVSNSSSLSATTADSSLTIRQRKTKAELEASLEQLESLYSSEDDWIRIFDNLINNSLTSRPRRRHTHATSPHFAPYRSAHRRSMRASDIRSLSLQSSPCHTHLDPQEDKGDDETDRSSTCGATTRTKIKSGSGIGGGGKSRASSAPPVRRTVLGAPLGAKGSQATGEGGAAGGGSSGSSTRGGLVKRNPSMPRGRAGSSSGTAAGGVDENYFLNAFDDAPKVNIFSTRELDDIMNKIRDTINNPNNDWDKRVDMLKKARSVVMAGGHNYDEFYPQLRLLEPALCLSIRDLRSQVVREACITVAYLAQELHHRVDHLCEMVLPHLIALIPNGAKVMSTSGTVCIRFIIQNVHHPKIVPIILRELTSSKSREIRKACCEFLDHIVHTWPTHALDRNSAAIGEAIKKGISDADSEARAFARKAYWGYADHFKEEADKLLNSLDASYKKMLQGEMSGSMSASNSSHSIQQQSSQPAKPALPPRTGWSRPPTSSTSEHQFPSTSSSSSSSHQHHFLTSSTSNPMTASASGLPTRTGSLRRTGIPTASHRPPPPLTSRHLHYDAPDGGYRTPATPTTGFRSNSAIDVNAARRAQARAQYANANRFKAGSGVSLPRPRKSMDHPPPLSNSSIISPERTRPRTRGTVSQSQPGSRSGSPSSRLSYATYNSSHHLPPHQNSAGGSGGTLGRTRRRSGIPRSTGTSREPSPNRAGQYAGTYAPSSATTPKGRTRSVSGASGLEMPPSGKPRQVIAEKILQQSREAENALADALVPSSLRSPSRKFSKGFDDQSECDSETSSVCSERSFDSYRRNELFWHGSQQRILKEVWDAPDKMLDVPEIITNCASTYWGERKEGLLALHNFLRGSAMLTGSELKKITEIFTKMFMDAHTKVFTLFLETLMQLIYVHRADLEDWLYVLLTRLLHKLGSDLLGSVQAKIHETLDLVRSSFPCDAQFQVIMRFLVDPTQTPNNKVKLSILTYLKCLVDGMERSDLASSSDTPVALAKILTWTADHKSVEIRRASSACFVAMFNCNQLEFTNLLQQLPPACQSTASQIIQNHIKRAASLDKSPSSLPSRTPPSSGGTPVLQSPNTSLPRSSRPSRLNTLDLDDTENLNPDEVYKSLKRTTDEIRNYSFELEMNNGASRDNLEKHRDSTSQVQRQDSGISQLSAGGTDLRSLELTDVGGFAGVADGVTGAAHGADDNLSGRSSNASSPLHRPSVPSFSSAATSLPHIPLDGPHHHRNGLLSFNDDEVDHLVLGEGESDSAAMASVIQVLRVGGATSPPVSRVDERKAALTTLVRLARTGSTIVWNDNFRSVLRLLVENLESSIGGERALVLTVLTEMMRRCPLVNLFLNYSELIILRVLKAHADKEKEVIRAAQVCAGTVAEILPPEVVIRVLKPLIQMGEFPVNQSAIKMLNKLVEAHPPAIVAQALPDIMPGLVKAYDNNDSSVRKASVFCMVSLHNCVGEQTLRPHLESLTGSKLKLLNLYIKRADTQNSGASSPKSEPQV